MSMGVFTPDKIERVEPFRIRPARPDEARLIGRFFQTASDGLSDYTWSRMAKPREEPLDVAERRFRRENTEFSYQNTRFAEHDGEVAGMIHFYPVAPDSIPDAQALASLDPVIRPLAELDVPGSLYVAALAVSAPFRGLGIGSRLMAFAEERGRELGCDRMSLAVFEANGRALRLYRRLGYSEVGRRPVVPGPPWFTVPGDVLMLTKPL